jgi:hypothetical protein
MWDALTGRFMQRVVIYSIMGHILSTAEIDFNDARFWCILILVILLEFIARAEGTKEGIEHILNMSSAKLSKLKEFIDSVARGEERNVNELNEILKQEDKKND